MLGKFGEDAQSWTKAVETRVTGKHFFISLPIERYPLLSPQGQRRLLVSTIGPFFCWNRKNIEHRRGRGMEGGRGGGGGRVLVATTEMDERRV